jgi:xanthine dehydrogenase accessory factor
MFDYLDQAMTLRQAGQPFALATVVRAEKPTSARAGARAIVTADGTLTGWVGGSCAQPTVIREALHALQDGQPRFIRLCPPERLGRGDEGVLEIALTCVSGGTLEVYIEPHLPRPLLLAVGHLPIVEALSTLGKGMGYAVTVMGLDATPERFPHADRVLDHLDFSEFTLRDAQLRDSTAVVVATHGNYDEEALQGALKTGAGYIALVASKTRATSILDYLRETGVTQDQLDRIKFPAGLDIGAVTPEEIALSILAEIVQVSRRAAAPRPSGPAEAPPSAGEARDPVCGMMVEMAGARYTSLYQGQTIYFCAAGCKRSFDKAPEKYLAHAE